MHCAGANGRLAGIDPRGANLDKHLARTGNWHVDIGDVQHIAPAVTIETDRARLCSCHADLPLLAPFLGPSVGANSTARPCLPRASVTVATATPVRRHRRYDVRRRGYATTLIGSPT